MKTRVLVGLGLALVFFAALIFGGFVTFFLFTVLALLSVYEMGSVFKKAGYAPYLPGLYACAGLMYTAYALYGDMGLAFLFALCVMLTMSERLWNRARRMEDIICSLFIAVYPLLFYAILACVVHTGDRTPMMLCFAGPLVGDTLAYFVGTALGKHKLCPDISPKKTIEGSIAGLLGGALGGALTWGAAHIQGWGGALPPLYILLALGLVCGALGQVGDLFASMLKRWAGVKDYGTLFPAHGGVMDRLDSVLFCAPIGLLYMIVASALLR